MHKYYDRRMFDVFDKEDDLKLHFAPKESEGVLLSNSDLSNMDDATKVKSAVDVCDVSQFIEAGCDVNFVGADYEAPEVKSSEVSDEVGGGPIGSAGKRLYVDSQAFHEWLGNSEFERGGTVSKVILRGRHEVQQ